jgi:hypothetical protein
VLGLSFLKARAKPWVELAVAAPSPAMAHLAPLAAGVSRFLAAPLVGRAFGVGCSAPLTCDLSLLSAVHACEASPQCHRYHLLL